MYVFWWDYMKPKYGEKSNLCYIDTDSFVVYIKTKDIYSYIAKDVETRLDASNYELGRPLPKGKSKKVIKLMKKELSEKIITEFAALRRKRTDYLTDENNENKKAKGTKKCVKNFNLKIINIP